VGQYQKGKTNLKTNLDFTEARDSEWQWQQLGRMQVSTSIQTDNNASTPPLSFFIGRMPFLPSKQQCQSTEGKKTSINAGSTNSLTFLTTDASYSLIFATKQLNTNATFLTSV